MSKAKHKGLPVTVEATALDRVLVKKEFVSISLVGEGIPYSIEMDHTVAEALTHALFDALMAVKKPDFPEAGLALYEAVSAEAHLEQKATAHGLESKFALTVTGQGSTKIQLRLAPEKVERFLAEMEQQAFYRRGGKPQ